MSVSTGYAEVLVFHQPAQLDSKTVPRSEKVYRLSASRKMDSGRKMDRAASQEAVGSIFKDAWGYSPLFSPHSKL